MRQGLHGGCIGLFRHCIGSIYGYIAIIRGLCRGDIWPIKGFYTGFIRII